MLCSLGIASAKEWLSCSSLLAWPGKGEPFFRDSGNVCRTYSWLNKSDFSRPACNKAREQAWGSNRDKQSQCRPCSLLWLVLWIYATFFLISLFRFLRSQEQQLSSCFAMDLLWAPDGWWLVTFLSPETGSSACHVNQACNFFHSSRSVSAELCAVVC